MKFFHATPVLKPGEPPPPPGVVKPALPAGTVLAGGFKLIVDSRQLFDPLVAALPDSAEFAYVLLRGHRTLLDNPQLTGILNSLVIEAITEYIRASEFPDRPPRAQSLFGSLSKQGVEAFVQRFRPQMVHVIYEVEPVGEMWFADMDAINTGLEYFNMPFPESLARQLDRARKYLAAMTKDLAQTAAMTDPEVLVPSARIIATAGVCGLS